MANGTGAKQPPPPYPPNPVLPANVDAALAKLTPEDQQAVYAHIQAVHDAARELQPATPEKTS